MYSYVYTDVHVSSVRACALRRDALLDRAGLKLGHGVDEERSGCGNMGEGKERVRADGNEGD